MSKDRRKKSKPEAVAEHAYFKLGTTAIMAVAALMGGLIIFFLRDMHSDMKLGQQEQIRHTTDIAINRLGVERNGDDITSTRNWLRRVSEKVNE